MTARLAAAATALLCLGTFAPRSALAGDVSGTVVLPRKKATPPVRSRGFVERKPNPLMETREYDPRPLMVVVLQGGPVDDAAKEPDRSGVKWQLQGESFNVPLLPIVVGTEIDLKNLGHGSPSLYSPEDAKLIKSEPISPGGVRTIAPKQAGRAYRVRATDSEHLVGRIVAFGDRYFSRVGSDGSFKIKNVPQGKWKVRVWYINGFVPKLDTEVEVGRHAKKLEPIKLPSGLDPDGPAGAEKGN